ncbi:MAG TPA: type VI secretion system-associated FHA domain protein TagH, partial [Rhodopila sp.]|nr:type VI secretion system-associated FHA domain protein TagH [Rhodopila sp.]
MQLTLSILAGPDGIARDSRVFAPGTFGIGRADDNDWVLPDPHRHLSKRHCSIAFQDGFWTLTDFSTNGTFLNDERGPLGQRGVRELRDGDRLRLGGYEIAVSIAEAGSLRQDPPATGRLASSFGGTDSAAFVRPFDPSGPIPFAPPFDGAAEEPFAGDVRPDHTPGIEDAFQPPRPVVLLDEDWDLSESVAAVQPPPPAIKPDLVSNPVAPVQPVTDDLLAAFLRGAGMPEAKPADPVAAMESLGAAFRALASGLRETLMARAAVKG